MADPVDPVDEVDVADDELDSGELEGLEVTVTGNVSEVVDGQAFRIDKDGLGDADDVAPDDDVAVFDEVTLETVYDVDFDDELYGGYDSQYVIVADAVKTLPGTRDEASGGGETAGSADTSTTTADSTTTTAAG